jgi:hypothetical protein
MAPLALGKLRQWRCECLYIDLNGCISDYDLINKIATNWSSSNLLD